MPTLGKDTAIDALLELLDHVDADDEREPDVDLEPSLAGSNARTDNELDVEEDAAVMTGYERSPDYDSGRPVGWRDIAVLVAIVLAGAALWWLFG